MFKVVRVKVIFNHCFSLIGAMGIANPLYLASELQIPRSGVVVLFEICNLEPRSGDL